MTIEETPRQMSVVPAPPSTPRDADADEAPAEVHEPVLPKPEPRQESRSESPTATTQPETSSSASASAQASETPEEEEEETEVEPDETEATITVQVGGGQSGLAGVSLRLYSGGASGPAAAVSGSWARCTSNGSGTCSFTIPDTHPGTDDYEQGDNYDQRFWVVQESVPSGWYANTTVGLSAETPYRFRTGETLRAGQSYSSNSDFMRTEGSSGTWQNLRTNPSASLSCRPGADIALVVETNVPQFTAAAEAMKQRLAGTNSTVTVLRGGLGQAAQGSYDLAIVVGAGAKAGSFAQAEQAIRSANAVKASGTRILAVGIGPSSAANLRAVAGSQTSSSASYTGADVHTIGLGRLPILLDSIATQLACETTVEVTQKLTAYGQDSASAGSGWTFSLDATNATITPEATQQTGDQGTLSYKVDLDSAQSTGLQLTSVLTDQQQAEGWSVKDSTCEINGAKAASDKAAAQLKITPGDRVECTFHAVQTLDPALKISKQAWGSENIGGLADAPEIPRGSAIPAGMTVTWTYLVTNTGETPLDDVVVTDSQLPDHTIICPGNTLDVGESMTCTASGAVTADH